MVVMIVVHVLHNRINHDVTLSGACINKSGFMFNISNYILVKKIGINER